MAIVVGTDAYTDIAAADAYFLNRPYATAWTSLTDDEKEILLKMGAETIDFYEFLGTPYDTSTPQALKFPRANLPLIDGITYPADEIPDEIAKANAEMALALNKTDITTTQSQSKYSEVSLPGGLSVKYRQYIPNNETVFAVGYLKPFLKSGGGSQGSVSHG